MVNVCWDCGSYRPDKQVDTARSLAICPECGFAHPVRLRPLLIVGGPSGSGKSTVCQQLLGTRDDVVLLEGDILWSAAFDTPETGYQAFTETWLRMAKNIGQSGRPLVLFSAGLAVPAKVEAAVERRYFMRVHYLALTCDDDALATRLKARPSWRGSGEPTFIEAQLDYNRWLRANRATTEPPITLLDTTGATLDETTAAVARWISAALRGGAEARAGDRTPDTGPS
jgi:hypothetical protein